MVLVPPRSPWHETNTEHDMWYDDLQQPIDMMFIHCIHTEGAHANRGEA